MKWNKALLGAAVRALALLPASRGAVAGSVREQITAVDECRDMWAVEEEDCVLRPAFHPELHSRYAGSVTCLSDQLGVMTGKSWANSCLNMSGVTEEFEQFIRDRTREE